LNVLLEGYLVKTSDKDTNFGECHPTGCKTETSNNGNIWKALDIHENNFQYRQIEKVERFKLDKSVFVSYLRLTFFSYTKMQTFEVFGKIRGKPK
jgi:hypothetical protein